LEALVLTLHVLACIILVVLVLLQSGKEGMGVIFGGGSSSMFGGSGAGGLLTKLTAFLAVVFLVTSLLYNILTGSKADDQGGSVIIGQPAVEEVVPAPEAPAKPFDSIQVEEEPKADAPKAEEPKADAPKTDAPAQ
jgi:preprotein translocase subunit SecG